MTVSSSSLSTCDCASSRASPNDALSNTGVTSTNYQKIRRTALPYLESPPNTLELLDALPPPKARSQESFPSSTGKSLHNTSLVTSTEVTPESESRSLASIYRVDAHDSSLL